MLEVDLGVERPAHIAFELGAQTDHAARCVGAADRVGAGAEPWGDDAQRVLDAQGEIEVLGADDREEPGAGGRWSRERGLGSFDGARGERELGCQAQIRGRSGRILGAHGAVETHDDDGLGDIDRAEGDIDREA